MSSNCPIVSDEEVPNTTTSRQEYEVFLSFRGPDTRNGLTDHLFVRLVDAGIRVYRDDEELRIGEKIGHELLEGIKQSKIAIPIFSKGYATSKWCLKELTQIVECMKTTGLKVMPIFYNVTPFEVRHQSGNYEEAFKSHEERYDNETIESWRKALRDAGELKGWDIHSGTNRQEGELVKEITNTVLGKLKKAFLAIPKHLVGLDHYVQEVLADTDGVKIIAIHGMGGMGKTTLGKVIYNHLLPQFQNHIFLADIRETVRFKGMMFLQERLISNIQNAKSIDFSTVDEGIEMINKSCHKKKVLLFLDDVDEISQLKALLARQEQFSYGSRIIITARNKGIFEQLELDKFYELSGLDYHQALQLFCQHAFQNDKPLEEYVILSQRIIKTAGGLPLALEVLGSLLCGKCTEKWISTVQRLEKVPHEEVGAKLRISFEALNKQQKQIFLDIACFFIGENKKIAIHFWDESELLEETIEILQQMSLIKIKEDHSLWMHDQLRDLGREIVREEHEDLEKRSRLWNEVEATKLLMRKMGSDNVRGINLNLQREEKYSISTEEFARLPNLRLLRVRESGGKSDKRSKLNNFFQKSPLIFSKLRWLSWHEFPHKYDTSNFSVERLVLLDLSYSKIKSSWSGWRRIKMARNLKVLNLTGCYKLVKTPNFSSHLKLERLILRECLNLVEVDESISMLEHLVIIDLRECTSLRKLPQVLTCTESLEELYVTHSLMEEIPNWPPMRRLRVFSYSNWEVPMEYDEDRGFVEKTVDFIKEAFRGSPQLIVFPKSIGDFVSLIELDLSFSGVIELPNSIGNLKNLKVLSVRHTFISKLPIVIGMLENLVTLDASDCWELVYIPKLPQSLISLRVSCHDIQIPDFSSLINLNDLDLWMPLNKEDPAPWWIGRLTNLESLTLKLRQTISLHSELGRLSHLTKLELSNFEYLQSIPKLPLGLKDLSVEFCKSLGSLLDLPSGLTRLSIYYCESLTSLDLFCLKKLGSLDIYVTPLSKIEGIRRCESLQKLHIGFSNLSEINGLEMFEDLTTLEIIGLSKLHRLSDLSNLKKLRKLMVLDCDNLIEIPGKLESLDDFLISGCNSLERIPNIPNFKTMGNSFRIERCRKIKSNSA